MDRSRRCDLGTSIDAMAIVDNYCLRSTPPGYSVLHISCEYDLDYTLILRNVC